MSGIAETTSAELQTALTVLKQQYSELAGANLNLDLTRGKPSEEQLLLSNTLDGILAGNYQDNQGIDLRNYGNPLGVMAARELFSQILGSSPENTCVGGASSLNLMYQVVDHELRNRPNGQKARFLCPVPGYDRHFSICEHLGIEMITVDMTSTGPDMNQVEAAVAEDPSIMGIWCVPRFSNPTGAVYSDETVARMARLPLLADAGFRVLWDNAYAVHSLYPDAPRLASIYDLCRDNNTLDHVWLFGSTSKVTFAGAGVAFLSSSAANITGLMQHIGMQTICPDKVNQQRHVNFLQNIAKIEQHMSAHADVLRPKFELVDKILKEGLANTGMAEWTTPTGGYFVSVEVQTGLAAEIVKLAGDIGVKLTPAGATFPYGKDPEDTNIRVAPSYPMLEELEQAMQVLVLCIKLATVRDQLNRRPPSG